MEMRILTLSEEIKRLIRNEFLRKYPNIPVDHNGYLSDIKANLIPNVTISDFKADLNSGSGNELKNKFKAIHSSSALAINHFGYFKRNIEELELLSIGEFSKICFEKKLPTGLKGTPPNLDLYIENSNYLIGIESKYLEYLHSKKMEFSQSYQKRNLPYLNDIWFNLISKYQGQTMNLDVAQLIKHSIGLFKSSIESGLQPCLFYLFWEPENYDENPLFAMHRQELMAFSKEISQTEINFKWQSYPELWSDWDGKANLVNLSRNLRARYSLRI